MSDLARKVCDALNDANGGDCDPEIFVGEARAAIRAVLSHFAEAGNVTDGMGIALERALSEGDGGRDLSGKYKLRAIAAAMAAALKEMGDE